MEAIPKTRKFKATVAESTNAHFFTQQRNHNTLTSPRQLSSENATKAQHTCIGGGGDRLFNHSQPIVCTAFTTRKIRNHRHPGHKLRTRKPVFSFCNVMLLDCLQSHTREGKPNRTVGHEISTEDHTSVQTIWIQYQLTIQSMYEPLEALKLSAIICVRSTFLRQKGEGLALVEVNPSINLWHVSCHLLSVSSGFGKKTWHKVPVPFF